MVCGFINKIHVLKSNPQTDRLLLLRNGAIKSPMVTGGCVSSSELQLVPCCLTV
jgi:hypothetical protein